ncbi:MAG: hypothetical protein ACP5KZ_03965 [bacterium]
MEDLVFYFILGIAVISMSIFLILREEGERRKKHIMSLLMFCLGVVFSVLGYVVRLGPLSGIKFWIFLAVGITALVFYSIALYLTLKLWLK